MKKIKLFGLLFFITMCSTSIFAQKQDIGVSVSSLNNIGFIYKKQLKKDNHYLRITGANFNFSLQESFHNNASLYLGWENRKFQNDKFAFIHGWSTGIQWSISFIDNEDYSVSVSPNLGYLLGIHYQINEQLYFNVETKPSMWFRYEMPRNEFALNFGARSAGNIWLVYNFKQ